MPVIRVELNEDAMKRLDNILKNHWRKSLCKDLLAQDILHDAIIDRHVAEYGYSGPEAPKEMPSCDDTPGRGL